MFKTFWFFYYFKLGLKGDYFSFEDWKYIQLLYICDFYTRFLKNPFFMSDSSQGQQIFVLTFSDFNTVNEKMKQIRA